MKKIKSKNVQNYVMDDMAWKVDLPRFLKDYDLLCIDNLYEVVYTEEEGAFAFKSLDKVDNYEPFVNLLEAYVVGNKFDKED